MPLIVEIRDPNTKQWRRVGWAMQPGEQPGSISHNGPGGRQIYRFGCNGDASIVERSVGGGDMEVAAGSGRLTFAARGWEPVARLTAESEPFEAWIKTDRMLTPARFRWRHE